MNFENILNHLKENLSEYRFKHTIGVAETAKELALQYKFDSEKAYLAGLLHDCAKEVVLEDMQKIVSKHSIYIDKITFESTALLHGVAGACTAKELYNIDDEIYDAICYHTTGKANMSLLTKIVYIADYIEPMRCFEGVEDIRNLAFSDLDKAIIKSCDNIIIHTVNKGGIVHPNTIDARNYLLMNNRGVSENEKL